MAGRVNTKFVFILTAVVIVLVGGLALVAQLARRDASDYIAEADRYLDQGEYKLAAESMQRAVGRSHSDPAVIQRLIEVVQQVPAADVVEANNTLNLTRQAALNLIQIDPNSEQYLKDYHDLIKRVIERTQTSGSIFHPSDIYIYRAAVDRLGANPNDKLARKYRGVYGLSKLNREMSDDDINQVRDDLLYAQSQFPDDPEVAISLARWKLFQAGRFDQPGGDADKAKTLRKEALDIAQALVDAEPDDVMRKIDLLQVTLQATKDDRDRKDPFAAIKPLLDQVEQLLLADPKPFNAVTMAASYLKAAYPKPLETDESEPDGRQLGEGIDREIALLTRAAEANPDDARYPLLLGVELKNASRLQKSRPYIEQAEKLKSQGEYLDVLLNDSLRRTAKVEYADLLVSLAQLTDDTDQQKAMFDQAGKLIDEITAAGFGENPRILLIKGRLALAQHNIREGLISIDKAAEKYDDNSRDKAEALLLSAQARAQQGDWGAAADRYEQLLQINPNIPPVRLALAGIYLRQRDLDKAQDQVDTVLTDDPSNERALVIQATLQALNGDIDQAIQTYRNFDLPNRPDLAVGLAQLMLQADRRDQAAALMQKYFDADPTNLRVLTMLLVATEDADQRQQLIDRARQAGADATQLALLEQQINPDKADNIDDTVKIVTANQDDPVIRAISAARLYAQAGEGVKAREALARAAKIDPDNKLVIDMQFNFALQDQDLDLAQQLADRATQENLDEAGGKFYQAQLLMAKGDTGGTIRALRAGLELVPINSDGWRLLGDALMKQNNDREAAIAFQRALDQKPDSLRAIRGLAAIRDRQGRHDEALAMLKRATSQHPENDQLQQLYLYYEGQYGDKRVALKARQRIQELKPDDVNNLRALALLLADTGSADQAEQLARDLIAKHGQDQPDTLTLANVQRLSGHPDQGAQTISHYIDSLGSKVTSDDYLMLARYQLSANNGQEAFQAYQKAISIETGKREASRELAGLLFNRGNYDRAVPLYRDLYKQFPDEQPLAQRLADGLIRIKQYDEAKQVLAKVDPGPMKDTLSALVAEHDGNHQQALELIDRAIDADSGTAVFFYERAVLNAKDPKLTDQVIQDLNTALSINPNHLLSRKLLVGMYQRRGDRNEAIRELTNMVTRHPENTEARLMLIRVYIEDGNMLRAKNLVREALENKPDDPTWLTVSGDLAMREDDPDAAIQDYKRVFDVAPNPALLIKVASLQIEHDHADDALALLRTNASMVNDHPILQAVMGRALDATGQKDQAQQVFSRAAERCDSIPELFGVTTQVHKDYSLEETESLLNGLTTGPDHAWIGLAMANLQLSDGQAQQVCDRLKSIESSLPADSDEHHLLEQILAPALQQAGHVQEALTYYQAIEKRDPDNVSMLNNLAYLLAEDLDKPDQALPRAQRAAELQPNNAQILDTLGWVQYKLGNVDQARQTLESSIAIQSLTANQLHLGELLIDQGYQTQAREHLQRAIDLAEQGNETKMLEHAQELLKKVSDLTEAS